LKDFWDETESKEYNKESEDLQHLQPTSDFLEPKLPPWIFYLVVAVCVLPFFLNLLGIDFSSRGASHKLATPFDIPQKTALEAMFATLSGAFVHTILEWSAFCTAIFTAFLALLHFKIKKDITMPIIGMALFFSGSMDAFHTLAADRLIHAVADNTKLIPFTWAICRLFNALIMIGGIGIIFYFGLKKWERSALSIGVVSVFFAVVAYGIIHFSATHTTLPQTMYPGSFITRPYDVAPLILFLFAGLYLFPKFHKHSPSIFSHALVISIIPQVFTQLYMAFGSSLLFDNYFNVAHFLKIFAYLVPFAGLCLDYVQTYKREELAKKEVEGSQEKILKWSSKIELAKLELENEIFERKQAQEKLQKTMFAAEAANRSKSEFFARMSHEIRTPMNAILGMADLFSETPLNKEQSKYVKTFHRAGDTLLSLINDILDLSKVEAGQMVLEEVHFDLNELMDQTLEFLSVRANEKGLELAFHIHPQVPVFLEGDSNRLRQVFINLIGNAIKFTDKGSIRMEVSLLGEGTPKNGSVELSFSVKDTGIGISLDKVEHIFSPFTQADSSTTRRFGGDWLGIKHL